MIEPLQGINPRDKNFGSRAIYCTGSLDSPGMGVIGLEGFKGK